MHLARLQRPFHRAAASSYRPFSAVLLEERFPHLRIASPTATNAAVLGCRYASVKSQGAYKLKSKKTIPKKMGAKKAGGMSRVCDANRPSRMLVPAKGKVAALLIHLFSAAQTSM